jgi:response regulator of citrate/malate metabolism
LDNLKTNENVTKFVIIDDDDITIFLTKRLIQQFNNNFEVSEFKDARLAIKHYKDFGTSSSEIILLDINMPIYNGWDFLEEFEKSNLLGNIFMFSSSIDIKDQEKSKSYKTVIGYISKPLNTQKIETILNAL